MASYFNRNKNSGNRPQQHRRQKVTADNSNVQEKNGCAILEGTVKVGQVNSIFQVEVDLQGRVFVVNAQLSGKLRVNKIRIVEHDVVILEVPLSELKNIGGTVNGRIKQRKDAPRLDDANNPNENSAG